jgi:uncharacterized protein (UPF0332 family)
VASLTPAPAGRSISPREAALLRISKADKKTLGIFAEGIYLGSYSSNRLSDLQQESCVGRLELAKHFLLAGDRSIRARPADYRTAISRYYYSMYHGVRSVVFFAFGGDDHESHSTLSKHLPNDFTDSAQWQNALKDARSYRNEADYEPYPSDRRVWRASAAHLSAQAPTLLRLCEEYLKKKGCAYL